MPERQETEWATIGKVVAPFGIAGELKVLLLTDIPDRFTMLEAVYIGPGHTRSRVLKVRPYKGEMVVLKLEGIDDANTAETLRNADITIPLDQLAQLPPDSYYQHDILGLQVYTLSGRDIGAIVDIMPTGGNDVYIIKGADGQQILIPAVKEVVKQVDLIRRVMYIDPIPGLLDENEAVNADEEGDEE